MWVSNEFAKPISLRYDNSPSQGALTQTCPGSRWLFLPAHRSCLTCHESQDQQHSTISSDRQTDSLPGLDPDLQVRLCVLKGPRWRAKPWGPEAPSLEPARKRSVQDAWAGGLGRGAGWPGRNEGPPHLEHVVDDVELDDRLPPNQVVHHGVVHIVHHEEADDQNDTLQNVTHLGGLQQTPVPATEEAIKARVLLPVSQNAASSLDRHW